MMMMLQWCSALLMLIFGVIVIDSWMFGFQE